MRAIAPAEGVVAEDGGCRLDLLRVDGERRVERNADGLQSRHPLALPLSQHGFPLRSSGEARPPRFLRFELSFPSVQPPPAAPTKGFLRRGLRFADRRRHRLRLLARRQ